MDGLTPSSPPLTAGSTSIGVWELDAESSIFAGQLGNGGDLQWESERKLEIEGGMDS